MANTLFIIEDEVLTNLPQSVRDKALAETKRIFAFVRLTVLTRPSSQFPTTLDFTDSIVKIVETDGEVGAVQNQSVRQQMSNILQSIRQHGINVTSRGVPTRFASTPERGGVGFQLKEIMTVGAARLAMTVTGGVAALESVKSEVVEAFADGRERQEILQHQRDAINGTAKKKPQGLGYFGTHQALIDTRGLFSYDLMSTDLARWPKEYQEAVGTGLGRLIAHEARHQYVEPHFNGGGLGASEPVLWGDKNFEQFDKGDQSQISAKIHKLKAEQQRATILLETLPKDQPFPF
jgi:hypothetical protein